MPDFEITSPEGKKFVVTAPDGATQDQVLAYAQQNFAQAAPQASTGADMLKSAGTGLVKGVTALAGLPGDVRGLVGSGVRWAGDKIGLPAPPADFESQAPNIGPPTSSAIQSAIESKTGKFYEPQTTAGKYAQTVSEFAPVALAGPGGIARKLVTQAAIPGVASEAAGQAAEGTGYETAARVGGALTGGLAGLRSKAPAVSITKDDLLSAGGKQFDTASKLGVEIKAQAVTGAVQNIKNDLIADGIHPKLAEKTFGILDEAMAAPAGATVTVDNIRTLERTLGKAAGSIDPTERLAATRAKQAVQQILAKVDPADIIAGDPTKAASILKNASGDYAAGMRISDIDRKVIKAELRAQASNSGQNVANTIRQRMATIASEPKLQRGFSADEIEQIKKIAQGTVIGNTARFAGNFLGGGGGLGALISAGAGHMAAGPAGLIAPGVGFGLKKIHDAATYRQVEALKQMLLARSPLGGQAAQLNSLASPQTGILGRLALPAIPATADFRNR